MSSTFHLRAVITGLAASLVTAVLVGPSSVDAAAGTLAAPLDDRPNIVFVLVDDMDAKAMTYLPYAKALLADQGAVVPNFLFNQALCCPSRTTMLRGQYSHNTGVTSNEPPDGGYFAFYNGGLESSTIGTWLQDAGYRTGHIGKYLNGYASDVGLPPEHVPVGWDTWLGLYEDANKSYNYAVNKSGTMSFRGALPEDYVTDFIAGEVTEFLVTEDATRPFYLEVTPRSPHLPALAADRHQMLFPDTKYPRSPAFNEADISDKPFQSRSLPKLSSAEMITINQNFRKRLRSLQAVDEMLAGIVSTLETRGVIDNTYIVFGSDNGWHAGEHRMGHGPGGGGKNTVYEEDIRVPLYVRGPGIPAGSTVTSLVGNVDLPVTFAAWAGVTPPDFVDGRSLAPLLLGEAVPWRTSYLLERGGPLSFVGVRTDTAVFVEYSNGEGEYYDLVADPYELDNLYLTMPDELRLAHHNRAAVLHLCVAADCRSIEEMPVTP